MPKLQAFLARRPSAAPRAIAFLILLILYAAAPNARPDFTRFNCHDSESYVALAWNMAHGQGYTRALPPAPHLPHTTWPPGVPALLAPAVALSGRTVNWLLVKSTMCLVGLAGVMLAWLYLRRVAKSETVADVGALTVAANPYYWDFSHQAMAETPLTVWLMGGLLLVDRVWANRRVHAWEAAVCGLLCGAGMLIRGHAGALVLAPLPYLARRGRRMNLVPVGLTRWLVYIVGFATPQGLWKLRGQWVTAHGFEGINHFRSIRAVDPNDPSSRLMTWSEVAATAVHNARSFVVYWLPSQTLPGFWPDWIWNWKGSGFLALGLTLVVLVLAIPRRPGAWPACLVALAIASLNVVYAFGGNARFWVPVTTLLTIAIVANHAPRFDTLKPRTRAAALAAIAVALLINLSAYVIHHETHPYASQSWRQLAQLFEEIAHRDDLQPPRTLTQSGNNLAFQLTTSHWAPLPQFHLPYSHLIMNQHDGPPPGSRVIHSVGPWLLIELAEPATWEDIFKQIPLATGQYAIKP